MNNQLNMACRGCVQETHIYNRLLQVCRLCINKSDVIIEELNSLIGLLNMIEINAQSCEAEQLPAVFSKFESSIKRKRLRLFNCSTHGARPCSAN